MSDENTKLPLSTPLINAAGATRTETLLAPPVQDLKSQVFDILRNGVQINGQNGQMSNGTINFNVEPPPVQASTMFHQVNSKPPEPARQTNEAPVRQQAPPPQMDSHQMSHPYAGRGQGNHAPSPPPVEAGHPVARSQFLENARSQPAPNPNKDASEGGRYETNPHHPDRVLVDGDGHKIEKKEPSRLDVNRRTHSEHMDSLKSSMPVTFYCWHEGILGTIMIACESVPHKE